MGGLQKLKDVVDRIRHREPTVTEGSDKPVSHRIHTVHHKSVGRHLAFTISDNSIQMAAARHLGSRVSLLDVRKEYFALPTKSASAEPASATDALQQFVVEQQDYFKVVGETTPENLRAGQLGKIIKNYVREFGGRNPRISVTLSGRETAHRFLTIPYLKGHDLDTALIYEGKRQVPFPAEDCWVDYRVTEEITGDSSRLIKASIVAATRALVARQLAPFVGLDLKVSDLYHTQDVIGQLLPHLPDFDQDKQYTLIDIYHDFTEISYYRGSDLEFFHVSSLGSSFLGNRTDPTIFEYFAESLGTEIQNSLDYYTGQFSTEQSQEILVYGDLSYSDDLIELLSDRFGFSFRRFPVDHFPFSDGEESFMGSQPVCLSAIAAATNQARLANLLPTEFKAAIALRSLDRNFMAAAAVVVLLLGGHWLSARASLASEQDRLHDLQSQADQFRSSNMFVTYNNIKRKLAANQAFLEQIKDNPSYLSLNLKELSYLVPRDVRLYDLEFRAGAPERNYLISGLVQTKDIPPEVILAELVENLSASPFYENVTVERHVKRRKDDSFVIDFNLSMRGII